jgi:hypothetical protein
MRKSLTPFCAIQLVNRISIVATDLRRFSIALSKTKTVQKQLSGLPE